MQNSISTFIRKIFFFVASSILPFIILLPTILEIYLFVFTQNSSIPPKIFPVTSFEI